MSRRRRPYWPWGIGLDKRQARRLRRRIALADPAPHVWTSHAGGRTWRVSTLPAPTQGETR